MSQIIYALIEFITLFVHSFIWPCSLSVSFNLRFSNIMTSTQWAANKWLKREGDGRGFLKEKEGKGEKGQEEKCIVENGKKEGSRGERKVKMNPVPWFGMEKSPFFLFLMAATNKMHKPAKEIKNSKNGLHKAV